MTGFCTPGIRHGLSWHSAELCISDTGYSHGIRHIHTPTTYARLSCSSIKREELYQTGYHSAAEFKEKVKKYFDFYNAKRPHSTLGNKTPDKHETLYCERHGVENR